MRLYEGTGSEFIDDATTNQVADKLRLSYEGYYGRRVTPSELSSWFNSLQFVKNILQTNILEDVMVILEYEIPYSNERIDCILFGKGHSEDENVVILELKQWSKVERCEIEGNVITFVGGANRMVPHPSIQVSGYHYMLKDFMEIFQNIPEPDLSSCVYCHNYTKTYDSALFSEEFRPVLREFPIFVKDDTLKLGEYLKARLEKGHGLELFNRFNTSGIKPSKKLIDNAKQMIQGQQAFTLIDEQITANNTIIDRAKNVQN